LRRLPEGPGAPQTNGLVTVEQAAQIIAVTPAAVRKWLTQRRLPKVKVGSLTRLRLSDVMAVVANGLPPQAA
jgi:excisionase family DNA binding protein